MPHACFCRESRLRNPGIVDGVKKRIQRPRFSFTDGYSHDNLRHVVITATSFTLVISTIAVILCFLCVFVYMRTLASGSFLYTVYITYVKLSILAFYKRLFPVKPMILVINIIRLSIILWCFGVCLIEVVTCIPFRKLWEPKIPGGCIDLAKFTRGLQIPNIVTDAIILAMPCRVVWGLNMPRVQRVLLMGIFALGALTLIFNIIRLVALIKLSGSRTDPCVGITAACLSNAS
ncbi:uncharacterized protein BDV17DRAFT_301242 [Aspergillus undulatus]|uniref:uncharacterized protein n=1 Tax=Aspergillus undulatus TaxID=1810928 RepID=UPI003CCDBA20